MSSTLPLPFFELPLVKANAQNHAEGSKNSMMRDKIAQKCPCIRLSGDIGGMEEEKLTKHNHNTTSCLKG